jgi:predicted metallo-beta-lactamase superfamily hydrolase
LNTKPLKLLLEEAVNLAPRRFQLTAKKALEINDTNTLVKQYAGTACSINQSIPIIIHLLYHSTSFDDMLMRNALISGAISERGMMLGAILGAVYPPSQSMHQKLSSEIKSIFLV